ncbi:MAG: HemK/PrmC family methyltransferase [Patescibacteria group bacterium]
MKKMLKVIDILKSNDRDYKSLLESIIKDRKIYNPEYTLSKIEEKKYLDLKKRLDNEEPIEYILNSAYFENQIFYVDNNVLIPRKETETIIPYLSLYKSVLDLGCGSGAVGITLKRKHTNINVTMSDISQNAIKIAYKNLGNLEIPIIHSDLLLNIDVSKFDCIFANLPYIDINKKEKVAKSVYLYEPHIALFTKSKGLYLINKLIKDLDNKNFNGVLFLELDPWQIKYIKKRKEIIKDQFGQNRFIKIKYI